MAVKVRPFKPFVFIISSFTVIPVLTTLTLFRTCYLDHNPLFIYCKGGTQRPIKKSQRKPERNGYFRKRIFTDIQRKDIMVKRSHRGVTLQPAPHLQVCPHLLSWYAYLLSLFRYTYVSCTGVLFFMPRIICPSHPGRSVLDVQIVLPFICCRYDFLYSLVFGLFFLFFFFFALYV